LQQIESHQDNNDNYLNKNDINGEREDKDLSQYLSKDISDKVKDNPYVMFAIHNPKITKTMFEKLMHNNPNLKSLKNSEILGSKTHNIKYPNVYYEDCKKYFG